MKVIDSGAGTSGYFIQGVNYVLDDQFRMCFKLSKPASGNLTSGEDVEYYKVDSEAYLETKDFNGSASGRLYKYHPGLSGFMSSGAYCQIVKFYPIQNYTDTLKALVEDKILSDRTLQLSLEFVTFEASQQIHTYSTIRFDFPSDGGVTDKVASYAMRLDMRSSQSDYVRIAFEIIFLFLFGFHLYDFFGRIRLRR